MNRQILHSSSPQLQFARAPIKTRSLVVAFKQHRFPDGAAPKELRTTCKAPLERSAAIGEAFGRQAFRATTVTAASSSDTSLEPAPVEEGKSDLGSTLLLGLMFAGWYATNVVFNIYNKQVLRVFPYPLTCTAIQFGVGSLIACFLWLTRIIERPKVELATLKTISPLAFIHTLGNMFTNISLGAVAPSFTHTIKASEPLFSVGLSALLLGERPTLAVVACLLPIIVGVGLASTSEISFNWVGFLAAMGSNLTFQSRNVLSKKFMTKDKSKLDNVGLFSYMTIMAFFILAPVALAVEGLQLTPAALSALPAGIVFKGLMAGATFHAYQQISYMILQRVSPVTHSVGNCVKRVVVIVTSVIAFNTPVSAQNALGTALALGGVFLYSQVKRLSGQKAKAA